MDQATPIFSPISNSENEIHPLSPSLPPQKKYGGWRQVERFLETHIVEYIDPYPTPSSNRDNAGVCAYGTATHARTHTHAHAGRWAVPSRVSWLTPHTHVPASRGILQDGRARGNVTSRILHHNNLFPPTLFRRAQVLFVIFLVPINILYTVTCKCLFRCFKTLRMPKR